MVSVIPLNSNQEIKSRSDLATSDQRTAFG